MVFPADDVANKVVRLVAPNVAEAETLTSGTGVQIDPLLGAFLYLDITGGASGTVKVELSFDGGTTYHTLIPATAANAVASHQVNVRVPPAAYVKVTVAVATIASAIAILD
jgi:hypothetical protein